MNPNATNTFDRLEPGDIFLAGDAGWTVEDKSKGSIMAVRGVDNYRHTWTPLDLEKHKARIIMDGRGNRWIDQTMTDAITAAHHSGMMLWLRYWWALATGRPAYHPDYVRWRNARDRAGR